MNVKMQEVTVQTTVHGTNNYKLFCGKYTAFFAEIEGSFAEICG